MINNFIGGGQVFLHKLRMLRQVVTGSVGTSMAVGLIVSCIFYYGEFKHIDKASAFTYYKALTSSYFDNGVNAIRGVVGFGEGEKYISYIKIDKKSPAGRGSASGSSGGGSGSSEVAALIILKMPRFIKANNELLILLSQISRLWLISSIFVFMLIFTFWWKFGQNIKSEKKVAGGSLLTDKEVRSFLRSNKLAGNMHIGKLPLVKDSYTRHFLVTGSTGSGKTNLLHNMLPQIEQEGDAAIVVDQTGEMIARYYNKDRGDIIFNPFDARGAMWDFWGDCSERQDLEQFSRILFGFNRKKGIAASDPFWENASETIFTACAQYLIDKHNKDQQGISVTDLQNMVQRWSLGELRAAIRGSRAGRFLVAENKNTAASILSTLVTYSKPITYLRDIKKEDVSFTLRSYFEGIEETKKDKSSKKPWLFLATKPSNRDLTLPLIAALLDLALLRLMEIGAREDRRVWFILDELAALGNLPALSTLMAEGRKYGACVIAGMQSLNQLYETYGRYKASMIFGQFGTSFFFRNNEPDIAKMISDICGIEVIKSQQKNTSFGANEFRDGQSYTEQERRKHIVEYSDIASLATGQCILLLPEPKVRLSKITVPKASIEVRNRAFVGLSVGLTALDEEKLEGKDLQQEDLEATKNDSDAEIVNDADIDSNSNSNITTGSDHNLAADQQFEGAYSAVSPFGDKKAAGDDGKDTEQKEIDKNIDDELTKELS